MGIRTVCADREDFGSKFLEGWILDGNCRHFRGSDVGEIGRIEKKDDPNSTVIGKVDCLNNALVICFG